MKKEDFFGKYVLRSGDLLPEEINAFSWDYLSMSINFLKNLMLKGLVYNSREEAFKVHLFLMSKVERRITLTHKPRVYLSGPISNHNLEDCQQRFSRAERMLELNGYDVFSPLKNGLQFDDSTYKHMRRDIHVLTNELDPFDYIYLMEKWPHSSGCKTEMDVAIASGIKILFEESGEIISFK